MVELCVAERASRVCHWKLRKPAKVNGHHPHLDAHTGWARSKFCAEFDCIPEQTWHIFFKPSYVCEAMNGEVVGHWVNLDGCAICRFFPCYKLRHFSDAFQDIQCADFRYHVNAACWFSVVLKEKVRKQIRKSFQELIPTTLQQIWSQQTEIASLPLICWWSCSWP